MIIVNENSIEIDMWVINIPYNIRKEFDFQENNGIVSCRFFKKNLINNSVEKNKIY